MYSNPSNSIYDLSSIFLGKKFYFEISTCKLLATKATHNRVQQLNIDNWPILSSLKVLPKWNLVYPTLKIENTLLVYKYCVFGEKGKKNRKSHLLLKSNSGSSLKRNISHFETGKRDWLLKLWMQKGKIDYWAKNEYN